MNHLTEEKLAEYAFDPDATAYRAELEQHVADCPRCSANLTFIRSVDVGLADRDAWEISERDISPARQATRELAARLAVEDSEADVLLAGYLANPARTALANIATRRKLVTLGVARRLIRAAGDACDREPLEALTFADAAIDVAEQLVGYPTAAIDSVRGHAWKERANAMTALGQYDASLDALDHAERAFQRTGDSPLGHALVQHARALVNFERGEYQHALNAARACADAYAQLGDVERYMRVRQLLANTLIRSGDVRSARDIAEEVLAWAEGENDFAQVGWVTNTLGRCALDSGDFSTAVQQFHRSIQTFRELEMTAEAIRPEWGLALVVLAAGKPADSLNRFTIVRDQFHRRKMVTDEALVALDMMDALHLLGRHRDIASLASEIIQTFIDAGMLTSALAAFGYLQEAAAHGTIGPHSIEYVRRFMSRLEREPALLFCPPVENI